MPGRTLPVRLLAAVLGLVLLPLSAAPAYADPLIPLPPPGQPVVTDVTSTGATLTWERPAGPVFRYSMLRLVSGEWQGFVSMPFNSYTLGGLTPNTEYTVAVRAAALAGSGYTLSPLSEPVTFTTRPEPAGWNCTISISADQYGGFMVRGTLVWSGADPVPRWTVRFTIATNLQITQAWNSTITRSGTRVTITSPGWNGSPTIPPGIPQSFGFNGRYTGTFTPPGDFQVDPGQRCTILQ
jgi:hypothetical protein